ncbi:unnamed protein product [Urochloa humidicola]
MRMMLILLVLRMHQLERKLMGTEPNDHAVSDDEPDEPPAKKKSTDVKQDKKEIGSDVKEKDAAGKKGSTKPAKRASKPSQNSKNEPEVKKSWKERKEFKRKRCATRFK